MVPTSVPFGCNAAYDKSGRPAAAGRMMMITGDSPTPLAAPQAHRPLGAAGSPTPASASKFSSGLAVPAVGEWAARVGGGAPEAE